MRCKHRRTWFVAGGRYEWCYECGAIRQMEYTGPGSLRARTRFVRPVGKDGENPYDKWKPLPGRKP